MRIAFCSMVLLFVATVVGARPVLESQPCLPERVSAEGACATIQTPPVNETAPPKLKPTCKQRGPLCDHGDIQAFAVDEAGKWYAAAGRRGRSEDGVLKLYEQKSGQEVLSLIRCTCGFGELALSATGSLVAATGEGRTVQIWRVVEDANRVTLVDLNIVECSKSVSVLAFSPLPRKFGLAIGHWDGTITIVDPVSGIEDSSPKAPGHSVMALAYRADGAVLASGHSDGSIQLRFHQPPNHHKTTTLRRGSGYVTDLVFLADGDLIASYEDSIPEESNLENRQPGQTRVCLWDVDATRISKCYPIEGDCADSVSVSADGKLLAIGYSFDGAGKHGVALVELPTGKRRGTLFGPWLAPRVRWLPAGRRLVVTSGSIVSLWSAVEPHSPERVKWNKWAWWDSATQLIPEK